jgi:hypothetical protein
MLLHQLVAKDPDLGWERVKSIELLDYNEAENG